MNTRHTITIEGKNYRIEASDDRSVVYLSDALGHRWCASARVRRDILSALVDFSGAAVYAFGRHVGNLA
jgi:hypothetical protein